MNKKGEKPAETYIVMADIPCPMRVAYYVDIIQKGKSFHLRIGTVDENGIIHHVICPLKLAYDLPIGAILRPGKEIITETAEYCGYEVESKELWLPEIATMHPRSSAAACEDLCRADNNICIGTMQGLMYRNDVYLLPSFELIRAFLGTEARLLTMLVRGDDMSQKYDIEVENQKVVATPHVRIADRTLKMLIEYNGIPELQVMLRDMAAYLQLGECMVDLRIPHVSGKLLCKVITVAGYHILLDADAVSLPVPYSSVTRVRQKRETTKAVLPPAKKPLLSTPRVDFAASQEASETHRRTALYRKQMAAARFDDKIYYKSTYEKSSDTASAERKNYLGPFVPDAMCAAQDTDPEHPAGKKDSRPELDFDVLETIPVELPPGFEQFEDFRNMLSRLGRFLDVREIRVKGCRYPDDTPVAALRGRQYLMCYINIGSACLCVLELARQGYPPCATLVMRLNRAPEEMLSVCTSVLQAAGGHWGDKWVASLETIARTLVHRNERRERPLARILRKLLLYQW